MHLTRVDTKRVSLFWRTLYSSRSEQHVGCIDQRTEQTVSNIEPCHYSLFCTTDTFNREKQSAVWWVGCKPASISDNRGGSTGGQGAAPNEKCGPPSASPPHFGPASLDFHLNRPVISLIQLHIVPPPAPQLELSPHWPPFG